MITTLRPILENMFAPRNSSNQGIGCLYFTVMSLMVRHSIHILQNPSFLVTNNMGTAQGLRLL